MDENSKKQRDGLKNAGSEKDRPADHNPDTSDHARKGTQEERQKYQPGLPGQGQKKEG
jgi:hypothetical protein